MYAVTGASGRLGRLILEAFLEKVAPGRVVALTRDTRKLAEVAGRGVTVRAFDFDAPETLRPALEGVERLLLISGSEIGRRERQHQAAINAAKGAGVGFITYTRRNQHSNGVDSNTSGVPGRHSTRTSAQRQRLSDGNQAEAAAEQGVGRVGYLDLDRSNIVGDSRDIFVRCRSTR